MATATKATAATATAAKGKRTAAAPQQVPAASHSSSTQQPQGSKAQQAAAPQAPLYTLGTLPPVRPGTHRSYAQHVAQELAKKHPKGFTLLQYRQALVAGASASSVAPPKLGWAKHNMPTWAAGQGWLVPVAKK